MESIEAQSNDIKIKDIDFTTLIILTKNQSDRPWNFRKISV